MYPNVEFLQVLEPDDDLGWHASLNPPEHFLNGYEFNVLVGSDGARKNRIPGFDRKELRGKLALAITANFKNYYSREEAAVEEISGVAFIFNQKFFKVSFNFLSDYSLYQNFCVYCKLSLIIKTK